MLRNLVTVFLEFIDIPECVYIALEHLIIVKMATPEEVKSRRGILKGQITKQINTINVLMGDKKNLDDVNKRSHDLGDLVTEFSQTCQSYLELLTSSIERNAAQEYHDTVLEEVEHLQHGISIWLHEIQSEEEDDNSTYEPAQSNENQDDNLAALLDGEMQALRDEMKALREARENVIKLRKQAEEEARRCTQPPSSFTHSTPLSRVTPPTFLASSLPTPSENMTSRVNHVGAHTTYPSQNTVADQSSHLLSQLLSESRIHTQSLVESLQRPTTKLTTFDGDPLKYWPFMRSFENVVAKKSDDPGVKLNTLYEYCSPSVQNVLQCCLVKDPIEGYPLALKLLKDRFGNGDKIVQAWVSKILDSPKVTNKNLQEFVDNLRCCIETLKSLNQEAELDNTRSLCLILQKVPQYLQTRWLRENHKIKTRESRSPRLSDVVEFLAVAASEVSDPSFGKLLTSQDKEGKDRRPSSKGSSRSFSFQEKHGEKKPCKSSKPCPMCGSQHYLNKCDSFKALRVKDRIAFIFTKKLCKNCFSEGHFGRDCPRPFRCKVDNCGEKHSMYLHLPKGNTSTPPEAPPNHHNSSHFARSPDGKIALPIVPVRVRGADYRNYVDTYALMDPGGTGAYCSQELISHLNVPRKQESLSITTLTDKEKHTLADIVSLRVSDIDDTQLFDIPRVVVTPSLNVGTSNIAYREEIKRWPHLSDLDLPPRLEASSVQLLIGQDTPELICPLETRTGGPGEPYGVRLAVGWTINGPMWNGNVSPPPSSFLAINSETMSERDLYHRLWTLDGPDLDDSLAMSVEDSKVLAEYDNSLHRIEGRYAVNIPFKTRPPNLPDNRLLAEHRLKSLGKRLTRDSALAEKYKTGIHELLDKGYAEEVPHDEILRADGYVNYIPHHPVLHPKKDKCRIVFDGASKFNGSSLNDHVLQGPDLANKLVGVLLRFRQGRVAFMSDIQSMFHQVLVPPLDRDALRFLWWEEDDPSKPTRVLRMKAHLFGGKWSPSAANYALKRVAEDNAEDFSPEAVQTVQKDFYVDDCAKSILEPDSDKCVEKAINLVHELRRMLWRGGMYLVQWTSNCRELLQTIPESEWAKELRCLDLDMEDLPVQRALGVLWDVEMDVFKFQVIVPERPNTRRGLLGTVSSVYDPHGFVSPFVVRAKMMLQDLCRAKLDWDDKIPEDVIEQWGRWLQDLEVLTQLRIPRCLVPFKPDSATLHHFADASERCYAAVSYLRLVSENNVKCQLLMSKSRLAPIKPTTIPRLELAAAVEAVKLDKLLRTELSIPLEESVFWSDSMIVLWYIHHQEKRFQVFVANRVGFITENSYPYQWRHVPSEENPADEASRGLTAEELVNSHRWISGPPFLYQPEEQWPQQPEFNCQSLEESAEIKRTQPLYMTNTTPTDALSQLLQRYSTWNRLKKGVGWLMKFVQYIMKQSVEKELTVSDLQTAETVIIKFVQQRSIATNLHNLRKLTPQKTSEGVICVGGRLDYAALPERSKHPWILPADHHVTNLIIEHYHVRTGHSGAERILAETRKGFWIIKGRSSVRRVLSKCITCRKLHSRPETQIMSSLPADRVNPDEAPFTTVGVDYFGPFIIKRARSDHKRYGCLFTCLKTRAVHLEVSDTLETDSFIQALQRFIARRGEPREIRCDNGTNFVGAQTELQRAIIEWNQNKISEFLKLQEIQWIFNTPTASWMGGVWERQIRSVRRILCGILNQQILNEEGLRTLFCIVENIINGRPITKLSDDPRDSLPLTPNHLLLLRSGPTLPPGLFVKQDLYRRRWRQVQYMADLFWKRWLSEYLPSLQEKQCRTDRKRNMQVGDLVLVIGESVGRQNWPLGLIMQTYPSSDGMVRSVQVKTSKGFYDRPVHKLCLLEGSND